MASGMFRHSPLSMLRKSKIKCATAILAVFYCLNFNLKCNTHNSLSNNVLLPRKFVRGPRQSNCPDPPAETAPICLSAQTIFLSIFTKFQSFWHLLLLHFRLKSTLCPLRSLSATRRRNAFFATTTSRDDYAGCLKAINSSQPQADCS